MKIDDILNKKIIPETINRAEPQLCPVERPLTKEYGKEYKKFERDVFNFLLKNKDVCGIKKVYQ